MNKQFETPSHEQLSDLLERKKQHMRCLEMTLDALKEEEKGNQPTDSVNHPSHYTWLKDKCGIEAIDICEHLGFNLGNAAKYILRAGHKHEEGMSDNEKRVQDLQKAVWYINREINNLIKEK